MNRHHLIITCFLVSMILNGIALASSRQADNSWEISSDVAGFMGVDIKKATGYDWLEWSHDKKIAFMTAMFDFYKLDKNVYSVENAVDSLDVHYYAAHTVDKEELSDEDADAYYKTPCLFVLSSIVGDKESDWGIKSFHKSAN